MAAAQPHPGPSPAAGETDLSSQDAQASAAPAAAGPRLAVVSRGDPLTPYLHAALARQYAVCADINVELTGARRALVAALTFRPSHDVWAENYMKSNTGFRLRSRLADHRLAAVKTPVDVTVQTHALFGTRGDNTMIYVDCTYREAMHGWPDWTPHTGRARHKWLAAETATFHRARHLFAFTDRSSTSLIEDYGIEPAKITIVGAGINFDHQTIRSRRTSQDPTVLFVGKDFARKGVDVLLKAFQQVRRVVPNARLQIVGTLLPGSTPDGVDVHGVVTDRARMAEFYANTDVFCLPSLFDPAPLVVLEAMAYGVPCVLSTGASHHVRDLVETREAGWSADNGNATSLAEGIITLLKDPAMAERLGAAARQAVLSRYLWDHVVERMAPAIHAATGDRRQ